MSKLTEDDIEALASGLVNRRGSDINIDYLDDADPDAVDYVPAAVTKISSTGEDPLNPDRSYELEQNTSQLMSDYHDFLSDMDTRAEELDNLAGSNGDSNDESSKVETQEGGVMACQTWDRGEPDLALATIPEDSLSYSPNSRWPAYPGIGYYDYYDEDQNQNAYRNRFFLFRQKYKGWLMIFVGVFALLIVIPSLMGKKEQPPSQAADDAVSTQQHIDYARDPVWYDRTKGWDGKTYLQAEQFCSAINGRQPCSYSAYCPDGKGKPPVGGVKDELNGRSRWAPISNPPNEWVQVGKKDSCEIYSDRHGPWGEPDEDDILLEVITRHVACCLRSSDDGYPGDILHRPPYLEEDDPSNSLPGPLWFNDSDGWAGTSYDEGVIFCKAQSMSVCPYKDYCPRNSPFLGVKGKDAAEWLAPFWGGQPLWVSVGSINTCQQRESLDDSDKPKVKYILCCHEESEDTQSIGGDAKEGAVSSKPIMQQTPRPMSSSSQGSSPSKFTQTLRPTKVVLKPLNNLSESSQNTPPSESNDPSALTKNEQAAVDYMRPLWYGRKDGYVGSSHQEATDFCESMGGRQLCQPEAYCPNGSPADGELNPLPLFLKRSAFPSEQWAPIDLNANSWLLVGIINDNPAYTCTTYESVHDGAQPLWGFDGAETELKEHIMCCLPLPQEEDSNPS